LKQDQNVKTKVLNIKC